MKKLLLPLSLILILVSTTKIFSQCDYTIDLHDSFGDGWNGNNITVLVNGTPVLSGITLAAGPGPETYTFSVNTGDIITTTFTSTQWPQENEYYIYDANGILVFADGENGAVPAASANVGTANCSSCSTPNNINTSVISTENATIEWNETGSSTLWNIEWGPAGFTQGSGTSVTGLTETSIDIIGLSTQTSYDIYIQSDCGSETSSWALPYTFSTASCLSSDQCTFTLNLNDTGNSWNGASVTVFQDGTSLGSFAVPGGGTYTTTVDICNGSQIELVWASGQFDNECIFEMLDPTSNLVYSFNAGGAPDPGVFHTFTSSCVPPTCPAPYNLSVLNISNISADLNWVENGNATLWNIEWGTEGFTQGSGTYIYGNTSTQYSLSGLNEATEYEFYVQTDCGSGDLSLWTGPLSFSTTLAPINNPSDCGLNIPIPDNGCINVAIDINSLTETQLGTDIILKEVRFIAAHTYVQDIKATLTSPNGVTVVLTSQAGGGDDNYGIIDGTCTQYTSFDMNGADGPISAGTAPFVGSFIPIGDFNYFNDDSNPNGYWTLQLCDNFTQDEGTLEYIELVFEDFVANTEANIITYSLPEELNPAVIDTINRTIEIDMSWETDINNLIANFTISEGAEAFINTTTQTSGITPNDFSSPVIYTVYAEDGITFQNWAVIVNQTDVPQGALCSNPIPLILPVVNETGNTAGFGDNYDNTMLCENSFMTGDDIVYEFTLPFDGTLSGDMTSSQSWIGMFITDNCPDNGGNCIIEETTFSSSLSFNDEPLNAGTYYLVISSYSPPQSIDFTFNLNYSPSPSSIDLGIVYPVNENYSCSFTGNDVVSMQIANTGGSTISSGETIYTYYQIEGNSIVEDTLVLSNDLDPEEVITFDFDQLSDFSELGIYNFAMWFIYSNDENAVNNSISGIYEHYVPSVEIVGGDTVIISNEDLPYTLSTTDTYETYLWTINEVIVSNEATAVIDQTGWYFVETTDINDCSAIDSIYIDIILSSNELTNNPTVSLYPNPNNGIFNLKFLTNKSQDLTMDIYNIQGQNIYSEKIKSTLNFNKEINITNLAKGVYYLKIRSENYNDTKKVVVK